MKPARSRFRPQTPSIPAGCSRISVRKNRTPVPPLPGTGRTPKAGAAAAARHVYALSSRNATRGCLANAPSQSYCKSQQKGDEITELNDTKLCSLFDTIVKGLALGTLVSPKKSNRPWTIPAGSTHSPRGHYLPFISNPTAPTSPGARLQIANAPFCRRRIFGRCRTRSHIGRWVHANTSGNA